MSAWIPDALGAENPAKAFVKTEKRHEAREIARKAREKCVQNTPYLVVRCAKETIFSAWKNFKKISAFFTNFFKKSCCIFINSMVKYQGTCGKGCAISFFTRLDMR